MYIAAAASAGDPRPLRVLHTGETPGPLPASPGLTSISYTSIDSTSLSLSMFYQSGLRTGQKVCKILILVSNHGLIIGSSYLLQIQLEAVSYTHLTLPTNREV